MIMITISDPWQKTAMRTLVLAKAAVFVAACTKTPPSEPPREIAPAPVDASAGKPVPPATGSTSDAEARSTPTAGKCARDSDCRTYSSYCGEAPCLCLVLAKDEPDKKCARPGVSCFVDPCMKKQARCENGACRLLDR